MHLRYGILLRGLPLALLALGVLAVPGHAQPADRSIAHVDGYVTVSPDGRCAVLKQHDGSLLTLDGAWRGLVPNDHVRLEGRFVPDTRCGGQGGFEVLAVQALWADDNHRSTYYDHLKDGDFRGWVYRARPQAWDRYRGREWDRDRRGPLPPPPPPL
jgi:hypothetical protein